MPALASLKKKTTEMKEYLERIVSCFCTVLKDNLVGIYLHGSYAFGCFHPHRSDLDFLVVCKQEIKTEDKKQLLRLILPLEDDGLAKGLEFSILLEKDAKNFCYPTPFDFHYSPAHRSEVSKDMDAYCRGMKGTDYDLAAHITVVRHTGIVLYGKNIESCFGPVDPKAYLDSILRDCFDAKSRIVHQSMYYILNLCRVLAYLFDRRITSKKTGGEWGCRHLPNHRRLIEQALSEYEKNDPQIYDEAELAAFVCDVFHLIAEKADLNEEVWK